MLGTGSSQSKILSIKPLSGSPAKKVLGIKKTRHSSQKIKFSFLKEKRKLWLTKGFFFYKFYDSQK